VRSCDSPFTGTGAVVAGEILVAAGTPLPVALGL